MEILYYLIMCTVDGFGILIYGNEEQSCLFKNIIFNHHIAIRKWCRADNKLFGTLRPIVTEVVTEARETSIFVDVKSIGIRTAPLDGNL